MFRVKQDKIDQCAALSEVFADFVSFIEHYRLNPQNCITVTCGDWDLKMQWAQESVRKSLQTPGVFGRWCNVSRLFTEVFQIDDRSGLASMLKRMGIQQKGRLHS